MPTKTLPAQFKVLTGDDPPGTYEALVSIFGNVDSQGDRVVKGAFAKTLDRWQERGVPIPVVWSHQWGDPFSIIGLTLDATEKDRGLWVKGRLDIDANDRARQVHRLMLDGRIHQFSFAYEVIDGEYVKTEDDNDEEGGGLYGPGVYELRELDIFEHGPCLLGANQETELLTVKGRGPESELVNLHARLLAVKEGRVLSAANESRIRDIRDTAEDILGSLGEPKAAVGSTVTEPPEVEDCRAGLSQLADLRDLYAAWES
jgi:HK97 family phage prohead protease